MKRLFALIGVLVLFGVIAAGVLYVEWNNAVLIFAMAINYVRYLSAPAGSMTTEVAASESGAAPQRHRRAQLRGRTKSKVRRRATGRVATKRSPQIASRHSGRSTKTMSAISRFSVPTTPANIPALRRRRARLSAGNGERGSRNPAR